MQFSWIDKLMSLSHDGIALVNKEFSIYNINAMGERILKESAPQIIGRSVLDFFAPEYKDSLLEAFRKADTTGQSVMVEARLESIERFISLKIHVMNEVNEPPYILISFKDISEARNAEKMLNLFARATQNIGVSLDYQDTQKNVIKLIVPELADWCSIQFLDHKNEITKQIKSSGSDSLDVPQFPHPQSPYGIQHTLKTGLPVRIPRLSEEDLDLLTMQNEATKKSLQDQGLISYMCIPLAHRNTVLGAITLLNKTAFSTEDQVIAEELALRFAIALDNSKLYESLRIANAEVEQSKKIAEFANQAKSAFLANMSHEIRTPLGAILGFVDLLLTKELASSESQVWGQKIKSNGAHLLQIIDEILDLSKIESGKIQIDLKEIDLGQMLCDVSGAFIPQARSKNLDFDFVLKNSIPRYVHTDPVRLKQILMNIIGNAIKFTEKGTVSVLVGYSDETQVLEFEVIDSGIGLSQDQIKNIFQPFSQADPSHSRQFGGTGLGLSLSRSLAQKLGGTVVLQHSEVNEGSAFNITICTEDTRSSVKIHRLDEVLSLDVKEPTKDKIKDEDFSHLKILVVEDYLDNQILVKHYLKSTNIKITFANDGEAGLKKALEESFDIIFLDIQMPKLDGFEVCKALRKAGMETPIIALTAHALKEEKEKSLSSGFDAHITKPLAAETLIQAIKDYSQKDWDLKK